MSLQEALLSVWNQVLVEERDGISLDGEIYAVRKTSRAKLREVDFKFEDRELRAVEQNPKTKSRWAILAKQGKKVMQFLEEGRYVAAVVDGKITFYH